MNKFEACIFLNNVLVCMNIKVRIGAQRNESSFSQKWKIGPCYGPKEFYDNITSLDSVQYEANNIYMDRCCLRPSVYTLACENEIGPFGWGNSSIEILGQQYCNDFVGYKVFRKVLVAGK